MLQRVVRRVGGAWGVIMKETYPVWVATIDDIAEGVAIASTRYPDMDCYSSDSWARHYIDNPQASIMRTKNVVSMVVYDTKFWRPRDLDATMVFFAARVGSPPWEALTLIKSQMERARKRGCARFSLGSETGVDLGPFALRLGFTSAGPNYRKEF